MRKMMMSKIEMKKGRKKRDLKRMYLRNPGLKMFLKNLDVRKNKLIPLNLVSGCSLISTPLLTKRIPWSRNKSSKCLRFSPLLCEYQGSKPKISTNCKYLISQNLYLNKKSQNVDEIS